MLSVCSTTELHPQTCVFFILDIPVGVKWYLICVFVSFKYSICPSRLYLETHVKFGGIQFIRDIWVQNKYSGISVQSSLYSTVIHKFVLIFNLALIFQTTIEHSLIPEFPNHSVWLWWIYDYWAENRLKFHNMKKVESFSFILRLCGKMKNN